MEKYGKKSADILRHKVSFFEDNDSKLLQFQKLFDIYSQQPQRENCKNCNTKLNEVLFTKMNIDYLLCDNCGHLNGAHEDTDEFCSLLYTEDDGKSYATNYDSKTIGDYTQRVRDIYLPKVNFLINSLSELKENENELKYADLGAGSGYFVSALKDAGLNNVSGYEVSKSQVKLGNAMMGKNLLKQHELADILKLASNLDVDVISLIGVLEHVKNPRELLQAIKENKNIKYLFFSVPLFSTCVFFEQVFNHVMPRHLAPAHTHLYTESSIKYFCEEFDFEIVSQWWFGSDMMDLYRNIRVSLIKTNSNNKLLKVWDTMFKSLIDETQLAQDKKHLSSEVHMLIRKK
jgi:2-polyprenyl-3-methyl-5-hydroxy-6-metoxy-1,4-benzoquinol methylase